MRKDAERNRQKLIDAASEIMRNEGGDAPMELTAERANLTRGTLECGLAAARRSG